MLIDTHCHMNMMVKKIFDIHLTQEEIQSAQAIVKSAQEHQVTTIINVGTSLIESTNCINLATQYDACYAAIGIHPNDSTPAWQQDLRELIKLLSQSSKIVAIGECGMDFHYPDYNATLQKKVFEAQIELALDHDLPLIIHTRDAGQLTLDILEQYRTPKLRGVIHCFSEDIFFAKRAISLGFMLGIGGTITYPKNSYLRDLVTTISFDHIILETDAPFLPPQELRGTQNHPKNIALIAEYSARLVQKSADYIAQKTTYNAKQLFNSVK